MDSVLEKRLVFEQDSPQLASEWEKLAFQLDLLPESDRTGAACRRNL